MKLLITAAVLFCASATLSAQSGPKSCDELKDEISKKIEANGSANPTLTIVDKGKEGDGKVVGTCGGGTKSILYSKSTDAAPAPKTAATPAPKPAPAPKSAPAPKATTTPAPKTTTTPAPKG
jgi:hypothetical protein